MKIRLFLVVAVIALTMFALLPAVSKAGSLEPTPEATDQGDQPLPTMKTLDQIPPTWSQQLGMGERFQMVMPVQACDPDCYGDNCGCTTIYDGVLDKETGLVWEQKPYQGDKFPFYSAQQYCMKLTKGGRMGWRLPTIAELGSLIDPTQSNPALPFAAPFSNVRLDYPYFSSSTDMNIKNTGWETDEKGFRAFAYGYVRFMGNGSVSAIILVEGWTSTPDIGYAWCVRGGHMADAVFSK